MSDEPIVVSVTDKVAGTIATKLNKIAQSSREAYTGIQQLQMMLNSLNGNGLTSLNTQLRNLATVTLQLQQAQSTMNAANAQALLILQRVATEYQRTQVQVVSLTTAQQRLAIATQQLVTAQQQTATEAARTATQLQRQAQAQNDTAASAQRLLTAQQQLVAATAQARTATINQTAAATNAQTAQQRLAEAQSRAQRAATDATTAQQRLATETQRTAVQTSNAAAAADRARLAALQLAEAQNRVRDASNGAGTSLMGYAKALAFTLLTAMGGESILKTADAYTILQNKLVNVAENQQSVNLLTEKMFDVANRTASAVVDTASSFQKFDGAMKQMGGGQAETLRMLETLNKAAVVSGASTMEAAAGTLQLAQAFGSGRLQGDEFRSIMENLPAVADLIAKSMGKTRGELKTMSSQGLITAEAMRKAFAEAADDIDSKFGKTTFTLAQNLVILNNRFTSFVGELNKSLGITTYLSANIKSLGDNLDIVAISLATFAGLLYVAFGPQLGSMLLAARTGVIAFTTALAANPLGLLLVGISAAIALIMQFGDKINVASEGFITLKDTALATWSFIVDGVTYAADMIKKVWNFAIDTLIQKTGGWGEQFRNIGGFILTTAKNNVNTLLAFFIGGYQAITAYWSAFPTLMDDLFKSVVNAGATNVELLVNSWQAGLRGIASITEKVAPDLSKSLSTALDNVKLELPRMELSGQAGDMIKDIAGKFTNAFKQDYIGDTADAFMERARDIAIRRQMDGLMKEGGTLRESGDGAAKVVALTKAQLARAAAMTKINSTLDAELKNMFLVNPQREIAQKFDELEIQLASKKIKLSETEAASLKKKISTIIQNKEVQQQMDSIYSETVNTAKLYNNQLQAADILLSQGAITGSQYAVAINKASEAYKNATDPLYAFNQGIQDQAKIYAQVGPAQEIERQVQAKQNELRAQGKTLTDAQTQSMRDQLAATQQLADVSQALNGYYNQTVGKQNELAASQTALNQAYAAGYVGTEQYGIQLKNLAVDTANLKMQMGDASFTDALTAGMGNFVSSYSGVMSGLSSAWGDFFTNFNTGFADSIGKAIVQGDSLRDSLIGVTQQIASGLISSLIKLGIQYVVNAALGQSVGASALAVQTAASVAAAATTAAAWAPAAALASLASFGANSVPAMAGIAATTALSEGMALASFAGFQMGGYTGNGGVSDIAGVVHGQEFVMNADATAKNRSTLEAMNRGASGVALNSGSSSGSKSGSAVNVNIENYGSGKEFEVQQLSETEIRIIARDEAKTMVHKEAPNAVSASLSNPNSSVSKSLSKNTQTQRRR